MVRCRSSIATRSGNVARLNGLARYGALIGRDRSVTFTVDNPRGERVCDGTFTNDGPANGRFSMSCFGGKFSSNGSYQSKTGSPNDHIIARGQTGQGQPVVDGDRPAGPTRRWPLWRHLTCASWPLIALIAFAPAVALAQSAGEVERCFQNPAACSSGGGGGGGAAAQAPAGGGGGGTGGDPAGGAGP